jgi:hypothetical protein
MHFYDLRVKYYTQVQNYIPGRETYYPGAKFEDRNGPQIPVENENKYMLVCAYVHLYVGNTQEIL